MCITVAPYICDNCLLTMLYTAELGIDLQGILKRSIAILMHRLKSQSLTDLDMGGPLLFTTMLSAVHLLVRGSPSAGMHRRQCKHCTLCDHLVCPDSLTTRAVSVNSGARCQQASLCSHACNFLRCQR